MQVTPAVGMGGLRARHEVVVTNLGPATATNVVLDEQLLAGEQLLSTSLGSGCSLQTATVLHCSLGTLAGRGVRSRFSSTRSCPPTRATRSTSSTSGATRPP